MPTPSKKPPPASALARFISSLRPDRRSGPAASLPLQTGFPTSLADLYVKNQSRLRKPSRKSNKHVTNSECLRKPSRDACHSADFICGGNVLQVVAPEERTTSVPDDHLIVCPTRNSLGIGFVVTVNILVLVLLAIFGNKLILGFTALAFFSWFLDSARLDLVHLFKPRAEMRPNFNLCLEQRSFDIVSPIREVEIQTESDSTEPEIRAQLNQSREIDQGIPHLSDVQTNNLKKKSILKRLLSNKRFKRKPREKDGASEDSIRSKGSQAVSIISEKEIVNLVTKENQEEQMPREVPPAQIVEDEISQSCEIKERISWWLVLPMVVLFGLMEGKAIALLLTIFCFISVSFIELATRKQSKHTIGFTL